MYEAPKNLWIEWMTEISEILRWTNVNTFVRQLTCLEVKTRTKPWWLLRNHWHQKVQTVGEFSKDGPAYLSVWISKFPRRSIKLQQLPTSTRNSRKMKKKKGGCAIFPMKIASGTNHYKPILTLSRLPMTKDFLVPINGTHRTGNASFGTTLWTQLALCHQVHWVFIAFHRQCLNYCQVIWRQLCKMLGVSNQTGWLIDVAVTAAAMLYATQHTPAVVNGVQTVTAGGWAAMQKDIDTFRTMSISLYMVKVRSHA